MNQTAMPYGEHCVMQEGPEVAPVPPVSVVRVVVVVVVEKLFSASTWKGRIEVELDPRVTDPFAEIHTVWLGSVSRAVLPALVVKLACPQTNRTFVAHSSGRSFLPFSAITTSTSPPPPPLQPPVL